MTLERDRRISTRTLQAVFRTTVYVVRMSKTLERQKGSLKKDKMDPEELKKTAQANLLKYMRAHAKDLGGSHQTVQRAIKKVDEKSFVRVKRTLLT
uniref:Uncharacterized protein n=1 Tax=Lepeophtheirus salmonis TaxID=72036 RepID=A0A0K2TRA4_LEPSM